MIQEAINSVINRVDLSEEQMMTVMSEIMAGECTDAPLSYTQLTLPTICSV
jgi:anthranilate phosphoribosyltransferase